ncbi:MAG: T9SS type A sorting domain-containing protein [Saprospiraceae bacterium]|nr:T9SS type A sorting domain-containing protein [Saprospiraceae bacterium]
MKSLYLTLAFMATLFGTSYSQSITVPANLNGTTAFPFTYIDDFITADTFPDGKHKNVTYLLQRGGLYFFTKLNTWTFDVKLVATGDLAKGRPVISRANKTGGTALDGLYRGFGSFTWDGLYIIMGEEGATASQYESTPFWCEGDNNRYIFNDCIIEKSRQGTIRIEGENTKTYITNCWLRNFGDYEKFQGNGRVVDTRDNFSDTVVIRNNVIHNILDRLYIGFRQKGLNYFDFSQNTVFNHVGRHGLIQLRNTKQSIIKDNLFMNPSIMGTSPTLANEQITYLNKTNYLFTIDSIVPGATMNMSNNNIFWTQDVLNHYTASTLVTKPLILSPEVAGMLADPSKAYFTEVLELNNVPSRAPVIKSSGEAVKYPDSVGITDIMVEDISFKGTAFDKGYLFDWSKFDPCYNKNSLSAKSASDGGAVGSRFMCNYVSSTEELVFNPLLDFSSSPNPTSNITTFKYNLANSSQVDLSVFDMRGNKIINIFNGIKGPGYHNETWTGANELPTGMYFANLQTEEGRMFVKIVVQK